MNHKKLEPKHKDHLFKLMNGRQLDELHMAVKRESKVLTPDEQEKLHKLIDEWPEDVVCNLISGSMTNNNFK